MQDPFRPNSNAQLMREAQIGFIVVGLLLCVLVYVAFYRLTNRSSRFDEIARNVAVAEPIDSDPYQAHSAIQIEQKLAKDSKGPFAAIQEFASVIKNSGSLQASPNEKVAQATQMSSDSPSKVRIKNPALKVLPSTALPSPRPAATGFLPVTKDIPNASNALGTLKSPRSLVSQIDPTELSLIENANTKKQSKIAPPVLVSKFGDTPSQDFLPDLVSEKMATKTDLADFEASPPLPLRSDGNSASHIPSKPPVANLIDKALTRRLPEPAIRERSTDFIPPRLTSQSPLGSTETDARQPDESSVIAQTSAFEPVEAASVPRTPPAGKDTKITAKVGQTYTSQKGDSLWTIAQTVYGDGRYFRALHEMNHDTLSHADSIAAGTLLTVSTVEQLQRDYPDLCPKQEKKRETRDVSASADMKQTLDEELNRRFYRTEDGDTLFEVARQRLGQASRYLEIYDLNRFRIPETANHLTPLGGGIELLLPQ